MVPTVPLVGGFLNCARCFFPKNLALVWHWSGDNFVKGRLPIPPFISLLVWDDIAAPSPAH